MKLPLGTLNPKQDLYPTPNRDCASRRLDTNTEKSDGLATLLNKSIGEGREYDDGSFEKLDNEIDFWREGRGGGGLVNEVSAIVYDDHEDCGTFSLGFRDDQKSNFELQSLYQNQFYDSHLSKSKNNL